MARINPWLLQRSAWDAEFDVPQPVISSSPIELHARSSCAPVPEEEPTSNSRSYASQNDLSRQSTAGEILPGWLGCSTWPRTFAFVIMLCVLCAAVILIPLILTNTLAIQKTNTMNTTTTTIPTQSTTSTIITSTTTISTTTTAPCSAGCVNVSISTSSRLAFYSFDYNTNDITNIYSASGISFPNYTTGYVGAAISFDATGAQRLSAPSMSLNSRSFTVELWFYLTKSATTNNAFFGQQSVPNVGYQCLFLLTTSGKTDMGFFNADLSGTTILQTQTWYHVAFVYDYTAQQKIIYLNGNIDSQQSSSPYLGTSGAITIGGATVNGGLGTPYYTGLIDHLTVSTSAKSACEILNDASLAAYFTFDGTLTDSGPNFLTAISSGASTTNGVVNQAAYLSGSNSYIQISGLTGLGQSNQPFSIAFWVYPTIKGVLVHVHTISTGLGWCTPLIGFSAAGNLITQVYYSPSPFIITGPVLPLNTWAHIAQTFSTTNGQQLYINGSLYASLPSAVIYTASTTTDFITIGNMLSGTACYLAGIVTTIFQGNIDELRIFSREITAADVCILSRP